MATQVKTGLIANDAITDAKIANVALTGVTASGGDSSTSLATTAFVAGEINSLIDAAPGALNTLNELAAALGDDAAFSTTVTNSIATKIPLAGGTFTGNVNITKETPYLNLTDSSASRTLGVFVDDNNSVLRSSGNLLLQVGSASAITIDTNLRVFIGDATGANTSALNVTGQNGEQAIVAQVENNAYSLFQGFNASDALVTQFTGAGVFTHNGSFDINGSGDISGAITTGAITSSGNLDVNGSNFTLGADSNAEINLRAGVGGTNGAINWTFNSDSTNFASIELPYDTRASTGLYIHSGYPITLDAATGNIDFQINGNSQGVINSNRAYFLRAITQGGHTGSAAGVGVSLGDVNGAELGPGYLTLARDDTANAKQILFGKNGAVHSYLETTSSGLNIGGANVGIGTTSPAATLDVQESGITVTNNQAFVANFIGDGYGTGQVCVADSATLAANVGGEIQFGGKYSGNNLTEWASVGGYKENATSGQYGGYFAIKTRANGGSQTEKMRITSNGAVTINGPGAAGHSFEVQDKSDGYSMFWAGRSSSGEGRGITTSYGLMGVNSTQYDGDGAYYPVAGFAAAADNNSAESVDFWFGSTQSEWQPMVIYAVGATTQTVLTGQTAGWACIRCTHYNNGISSAIVDSGGGGTFSVSVIGSFGADRANTSRVRVTYSASGNNRTVMSAWATNYSLLYGATR